MKLFYTLSILLLLCPVFLTAQNGIPSIAGAKAAAMGNANVAASDISSLFANQAGLVDLKEVGFMSFGERRFLNTGLNNLGFGVAIPTQKNGTFGLTLNHFGYDAYNEQKIALAYARKLSKRLALSGQFDYLRTSIQNYGNTSVFTFEIGLLAKVSKQFHLGAHLYSPARVKLNENDYIPTVFKLGGLYKASEKLDLALEVEKDMNAKAIAKVGLSYHVAEPLFIRAGVSTEPSIVSLGIGLVLNQLHIDIASAYHQVLGVTPSISIAYFIKKQVKHSVK